MSAHTFFSVWSLFMSHLVLYTLKFKNVFGVKGKSYESLYK